MYVYNELMQVVDAKEGGIYFVSGHGGTHCVKTFLWNTIVATLKLDN